MATRFAGTELGKLYITLMKHSETYKLACAVLLILSSIALAFLQAIQIGDIASGVLIYIAQAFMLAGALFGLDYYIEKLRDAMDK